MIMDIVPPAEDINARSKSIRSGKVSLWKSERDALGHTVPSLRRCSARQLTVSIKVRENKEVKIAAGNRPRVTPNVGTAALPLLAQPIPAAHPSIVPENVTGRPPEETDLLHFLADLVLHEGERRGAGDEPHIQLSVPPSTDSQEDDAPSNRADRLKRADREEALRRCIFSYHESINKYFPIYFGKGTYNCPLSLINCAATKKGSQGHPATTWHRHGGCPYDNHHDYCCNCATGEREWRRGQSTLAGSAQDHDRQPRWQQSAGTCVAGHPKGSRHRRRYHQCIDFSACG